MKKVDLNPKNKQSDATRLPDVDFKKIIADAPLVSIDLIIKNDGRYLLGRRLNRPAKGYWFVPGGRIRKNESIHEAFERLVLEELACEIDFSLANFVGVFEHFYRDSVYSERSSTHYVVLAYKVEIDSSCLLFPTDQHGLYCWIGPDDISFEDNIHPYSKAYLSF